MYARLMRCAGRVLFGIGLCGLGILAWRGNFAGVWQMAPKDFRLPAQLAYASAALLIASPIAMLLDRFLVALPILLAIVFVLPQLFRSEPWGIARLEGLAEIVAAFCGAWVLARLPRHRIVQGLFGLCCIQFGLAHFQYAKYTASMVPGFLPGHLFFAYLTGAGHLLAGAAMLTGVLSSYGAIAEAAMLSSFVLLVHLPSLFGPVSWTSSRRFVWIELFWAITVTAAAWSVASAAWRGRLHGEAGR